MRSNSVSFILQCKSFSLNETELRNFVSENIKNGKWQLVFQFLAGLMEDKVHLPSAIITDLPVKTEEEKSAGFNEQWTENEEPRKVTLSRPKTNEI